MSSHHAASDGADSTLRLVPGSLEVYAAELARDYGELARLLAVGPIAEWPPQGGEHDEQAVAFFRDALTADATLWRWLAFYVCVGAHLVGSAGFMGAPVAGTAEIGYSICARHRRRGFATGAVRALVEHASAAGVDRLIAHTRATNTGSISVLERNGFVAAPQSDRDGYLRFVRQGR